MSPLSSSFIHQGFGHAEQLLPSPVPSCTQGQVAQEVSWMKFCLYFFSSVFFYFVSPLLPLLSTEVPMDCTRNVSDSFLRKLHPLPVCVPPHCHLPLPWPPAPSTFLWSGTSGGSHWRALEYVGIPLSPSH